MLYSNKNSFVESFAVGICLLFFVCGGMKVGSNNDNNRVDNVYGFLNCTRYERPATVSLINDLSAGIIRAERYYSIQNVIKKQELLKEQIAEEIRLGEMELLAQLVEAEAGNQDFKGKRLVADVVLNRLERDGGTIGDIIFADDQFSCIKDGGFDKAAWNMSEESFEAARLEYEADERLDSDIRFFTAGGYNKYCIPAYKYGDHYFGY